MPARPSESSHPPSKLNLLKLAKNERYPELESAWMAALEQTPVDVEEMFHVAEYLVRRERAGEAGTLLWALMAAAVDWPDAPQALSVAHRAAALAPNSGELRDEVAKLYGKVHAATEGIQGLIKASVLRQDLPLDVAMRCLDT
ncbi:MAG: hypothetical protein FJ279_32250, partial [Planctomycetes bacterium]|nr:hypothetical protein [Planctomycetota bacterium]